MSAQFTLDWSSTNVQANPNATAQRAAYRYKAVGGSFITTGFTPANDLAKTAITADSPSLDDNKVIEFEILTICTVSGPTTNDNGIQEAINFACITPALTNAETQSQIVITLTGLDITKARLTLKKASDNSIVLAPTIVNKVSNAVTYTKTGLVGSTNYYWEIELYATVQGVEVKSSDAGYLGISCSPYAFTTSAPSVCAPVTAMDITSVEIP